MVSSIGRTTSAVDVMPAERASIKRASNEKATSERLLTENKQTQNKQAQNSRLQNAQSQSIKRASDTVSWSRQAILEIDQYPVFAGLGYKSPIDLAKETSQKARQHAAEYIGKTASDGDRLAAIELGGSPIADIAERDAFQENTLAINTTPLGQPKFDVKYITKYYKADGTIAGTKVDRFI